MCRQRVYLMGRQAIIPKHEGRATTLECKRDVEIDEGRGEREREKDRKRVSV